MKANLPANIFRGKTASLACLSNQCGPISLTVEERHLLETLRADLGSEFDRKEEISNSDMLLFALNELDRSLKSRDREDLLLKLQFHLLRKAVSYPRE